MALKGIRVIEIAGLAPVPFCGMILADYGADVIRIDKVEADSVGTLGNGKKSVALDLKQSKGCEILRKLVKTSDVLIEPFRPGVMERLGLGPNVLMSENQRLVYARLSGYGQEGPWALKAGHDINYLSISGVLHNLCWSGSGPTPPINLAADFGGGGLTCALGIFAALLQRHKSGRGQVVDTSMSRGAAYLSSWIFRGRNMGIWGNSPGHNFLDGGSFFYNVYKTKDDRWMSVGALEPKFYFNLLKGLNISPEDLPQFTEFSVGKEKLSEAFKQKTQAEWAKIFEGLDACVTPILSPEEAVAHPHNKSQNAFLTSNDGCVAPTPEPRLSETPSTSLADQKEPSLGQHTLSVLLECGYHAEEALKLHKDKVIYDPCLQEKI